MLQAFELGFIILAYGAIAVASGIIMYYLIPEAKKRSLEDKSMENIWTFTEDS